MKYYIIFLLLNVNSVLAQTAVSYTPLWPLQEQISIERHNALVQWFSDAKPIGGDWDVDWQQSAPLILRQMNWVLIEYKQMAPTDIRQDRILVHLDARGRMTNIEIR